MAGGGGVVIPFDTLWRSSVERWFCFVARNCNKLSAPSNGYMAETQRGGVLTFSCNPGYNLVGSAVVYCAGFVWNTTAPVCQSKFHWTTTLRSSIFFRAAVKFSFRFCTGAIIYGTALADDAVCNQTTIGSPFPGRSVESQPSVFFCDFEIEGSCGWFQDSRDSFDWLRFTLATPSNHIGTGPSTDHTPSKQGQGTEMREGPQRLEEMAPTDPLDPNLKFAHFSI